jgi:twitching motility protein PilT
MAGRLAVHEILLRTESLPNIIREGQVSNLRTMIQGNQAMGMVLMDVTIMQALERGDITPMEAYMKASEKKEFLPYLPADAVLD